MRKTFKAFFVPLLTIATYLPMVSYAAEMSEEEKRVYAARQKDSQKLPFPEQKESEKEEKEAELQEINRAKARDNSSPSPRVHIENEGNAADRAQFVESEAFTPTQLKVLNAMIQPLKDEIVELKKKLEVTQQRLEVTQLEYEKTQEDLKISQKNEKEAQLKLEVMQKEEIKLKEENTRLRQHEQQAANNNGNSMRAAPAQRTNVEFGTGNRAIYIGHRNDDIRLEAQYHNRDDGAGLSVGMLSAGTVVIGASLYGAYKWFTKETKKEYQHYDCD